MVDALGLGPSGATLESSSLSVRTRFMLNFLHTFSPQPILFSFGPINIYWYGFFVVSGALLGLAITFKLAKKYGISSDKIFDLAFWIILGGIVGARIYDVFLNFSYYLKHPLQTIEIWKGGLAIHGGIIAGLIIIFIFSRKNKINFWKLTSLIAPGLALAQSIGRWGNYFNQELFGLPTNFSWGIPINILNRPVDHLSNNFFHPTFLYESIGCLVIGLILILANFYFNHKKELGVKKYIWMTALYMILYSLLRFGLEFIRIDKTPIFLGLRWPQIISLIIITAFITIIFHPHARSEEYKKNN